MTRLAIDDIPAPPLGFQIETGANDHLLAFETVAQAKAEDAFRKRRISGRMRYLMGASKRKARKKRRAINHLRKLRRAIGRTSRRRERSLASATRTRDLRQRVIGQMWCLLIKVLDLSPRTCTLIPRGWEVPTGELSSFDPRRRLQAIRSLINRSGGGTADGFLIAFVHGEFEPSRRVYVMHLHMLVAGGMRDVVDKRLRHNAIFKSLRGANTGDPVRQRLRMDRRLQNLPAPLTYLLKSFWPCKWQGPVGTDGRIRRQRRGSRIPEPYHSEMLTWLDRWQLKDITLLMNIAVGSDGFALADRAYTNGEIR